MLDDFARLVSINIPPLPYLTAGRFRYFEENEKHITRVCKDFVLIFMLDRTLYFTEDGKDVEIRQGEWYLQIPGLKQEGRIGSPAPTYYYIHFRADDYFFHDDSNNIKELSGQGEYNLAFSLPIRGIFDQNHFLPMFNQMEAIHKRYPTDIFERQAVFLTILRDLQHSIIHSASSTQLLINKVMNFLADNYTKPIICDNLSSKFHFTTNYLTKKMKQYYGTTPWKYVQQLRIERAKELIENTDYTMFMICNDVGYSDFSVFYKAFFKHTGFAPGEWRKRTRKT